MISLKQLRYFDAVVRTGHFGRAAEQYAVTQPALSMQIQELEKTLAHGVASAQVFPVVCGSAAKEIAIDRLASFGSSRSRTCTKPTMLSYESW